MNPPSRSAENGGWRPLLRIDVDGVGVRHQQQRPLLAGALDARDEFGPMRFLREQLHRDAFGFEHLLEVIDDRLLAARRIGGVHLDDGLEVLQRLGFDLRPVRLRRTAR